MKKTLFTLFAIITLSSCAPSFYQKAYVCDFSKYTEEGFIVSPVATGYDNYKPLGTVCLYFQSGVRQGYEGKKEGDNWYKNWFQVSQPYMLDELVKEAKKLGGNGILNFRTYYDVINKQGFWIAEGFAVQVNINKMTK